MSITGRTAVFGLVGHPVRHSLSPALHNALFAAHAIDAVYVAFDVRPERGVDLAAALRTLELRGVNLTVPFKQTIVPHLDHRTRAVEEAGAANVVIQVDGELTGYNTDGEGFCRGFEEEFGSLAGRAALVLGSGGAARAVAAGVADRGAAQVTFLNRTVTAAQDAADALTRWFPRASFHADALTASAFLQNGRPDVVINALAGGAEAAVEALPIETLPDHAVWCDINYWMPTPPGLDRCRARGLKIQEGLPMLVHQGALSFELFTGVPVDPAHIRAHMR